MVVVNHTYASIGSFIPMQIQGGGCLTKNEKVLMENNKWKFINNIKIGDYVQTLNGPREVLATHKFNEKELVELELNNGRVIKCTPEHKFLVGITDNNEKIWKKAIDLNEEDEILAI
jgi:intein/homing endonuclease